MMENMDLSTVKAKMKATWMNGDYAEFCTYMEPGAIQILREWKIAPGMHFLDIGCGAGQLVIPAARAGIKSTGVDIATNLIEHARGRATREGLPAQFDEGDAEQLPYADEAFDVVVSLFGAMFAPRPDKVALELARVCRSGGQLFMGNWTPGGMAEQMFKHIATHVPPPTGIAPPPLWGDESTVQDRLAEGFTDIQLTRKIYPLWKYPFPVPDVIQLFARLFGPIKGALAKLPEAGQRSLLTGLEEIFSAHNQAQDGTTELRGEYLEVAATRR
jgi:ubiquinone/menaquinone biosynthesis C-methylase UbiE